MYCCLGQARRPAGGSVHRSYSSDVGAVSARESPTLLISLRAVWVRWLKSFP